MDRRSFFNKLGAAILGTAIALKIPDSIIPTAKVPEPDVQNVLTFAQLDNLYNHCKNNYGEPKYIYISSGMYKAIQDKVDRLPDEFAKKHHSLRDRYIKFRGAEIRPMGWFDNIVNAIGPTYSNCGRLYINQNEIV